MNRFGIVYDERMKDHVGPSLHPECPERIEAIYNVLQKEGLLMNALFIQAREVTDEELLTCHDKRYIDKIKNKMRLQTLNNNDMFTSVGTYLAARLAAGSAIELANSFLKDEIDTGFAIVRPPAHHAKTGACGGFCFFNNTMLAATKFSSVGKKVYIVDWDLHAADGSINIMGNSKHKDNKLINLFSIHRWDNGLFYPGGNQGKTGMDRTMRIVRVGYNGPQTDEYYVNALNEYMVPHMIAFNPDIVLISAGFDAALGDPMEGSYVTADGYKAMTEIIQKICPKIGMILEGGYSLRTLSNCALSCVKTLQKYSE